MKKQKLSIVFMGTSDFASIILKSLLENNYYFSAIITQPDNKSTRRKESIISPVKKMCQKEGLKDILLQPEKLNVDFINKLKKLSPDLIIVAAYGKILPEKILEMPRFKSINVHASFLPKLRGPSPIQNALLQGLSETGTTIMLMDKGIDTGDILAQKKIKIKDDDDYLTLTSKLAILSSNLLINTLPKWIAKKIKPREQNTNGVTLCQLIEKNDGKIIWNADAKSIYNKFRAFRIWPGIFTNWENKNSLHKISLTDISLEKNTELTKYRLGEVFRTSKGKVAIQTGNGIIILNKLQLTGKNETNTINFINGYPQFIGSVLK